jgi:putative ABC transport system permease protein
MPPDFNYPYNGGVLWTPLIETPHDRVERASHFLQVLGLLKKGVSIGEGRNDLVAIATRASAAFPETNAGRSVNVIPLTEDATRGSRQFTPVMFGAVGFVLLIACSNVANLLLARGAARQKEMAIRSAVGASRWRLVRMLLVESLLLAGAGGSLGLWMSSWGLEVLSRSIPEDFVSMIPGWQSVAINQRVLLFALCISVVTALLCGLWPAFQCSRTSFNEGLKDGTRGTSGKPAHNRSRNFLVVAEVALSVVFLVGAGLMIRSFIEMLRSDFGVEPAGVLTMEVALPGDAYATEATRVDLYERLLDRLESLPGVSAAGGVGNLPMGGSQTDRTFERIGSTVYPQGRQPDAEYTRLLRVTSPPSGQD